MCTDPLFLPSKNFSRCSLIYIAQASTAPHSTALDWGPNYENSCRSRFRDHLRLPDDNFVGSRFTGHVRCRGKASHHPRIDRPHSGQLSLPLQLRQQWQSLWRQKLLQQRRRLRTIVLPERRYSRDGEAVSRSTRRERGKLTKIGNWGGHVRADVPPLLYGTQFGTLQQRLLLSLDVVR